MKKYTAQKIIEVQKPNVKSAFIFKAKLYAEEGDTIHCDPTVGLRDMFTLTNISKGNLSVIADRYEIDLLIKNNYIKEI